MKIESERIKSVMKEICANENKNDCYMLMSQLLDFISLHENMPLETLQDNIKEIIEQEAKVE